MDHMRWIMYSGDEALVMSELMTLDPLPDDIFPQLQSWMQDQWIRWTIEGEDDFHYKRSLIKTRPRLIYYMWDISLLDHHILWIVWPRKHSSYASDVLTRLFTHAPRYALATISGLAPGVDQLVHTLSLQKWVPTIAVLGAGFHHFLSQGDRYLIQQIVANGWLVLSEFKIHQKPQSYTFPQRNRIIAGLSERLLLPEAGDHSWSLITAQYALDMGIPVYGIPNSIFSPTSVGVNDMISAWRAQAVTDVATFLDKRFLPKDVWPLQRTLPQLSSDEQLLVSVWWEKETCTLTDFLSVGSLSSSSIISLLTLLEIKNYISQPSPGVYKLLI